MTHHPNPEAIATVREALETSKLYLENEDFSNGVTDPTGSIDEGRVWQFKALNQMQVALAALDTISAAQVPLPNCDVCKQPQIALGALHFSPPDSNGMCKKTHICVKCEAAPQVPEGNGQRIIDGLKDAVAYAKGDKSKETSETFNAVPQVSRDVDEYRSALIEISKETAYSGQSGYPTQGALIAQCAIATENLHADDIAVNSFARHMAAKMAKSRAKGRSGWNNKDECTAEHLSQLLIGHLEKGDPVDVANFCMMLHQRGERIVIAAERSASDRLREALTRLMPLAEEACDEHSERPEDNVDIMFARETIASRRS